MGVALLNSPEQDSALLLDEISEEHPDAIRQLYAIGSKADVVAELLLSERQRIKFLDSQLRLNVAEVDRLKAVIHRLRHQAAKSSERHVAVGPAFPKSQLQVELSRWVKNRMNFVLGLALSMSVLILVAGMSFSVLQCSAAILGGGIVGAMLCAEGFRTHRGPLSKMCYYVSGQLLLLESVLLIAALMS